MPPSPLVMFFGSRKEKAAKVPKEPTARPCRVAPAWAASSKRHKSMRRQCLEAPLRGAGGREVDVGMMARV